MIKLYHGGEFTNFRDRKYIEGKVNYVDMVDIDEFFIHKLDAIMRGLRYGVPPFIYYHFLVPNGDFQFGLRPLGNNNDLFNLAQYVADHKLIRVYTEHGTTPVLEQVIETPSKIDALLVSNDINAIVPISPEYNRTRFWNKDKVLSSYTKRLIMEEFDIGLYQQILEADSGLISALAQMFPNAEHRICIRHINENMRRSWRTREYKELLWKCAKATTVPEFNRNSCKHVIAVLYDKADNGENVGELYTYVHRVHWLESWKSAYSFKIDPIKGRVMWPISDCPMKITPPPHHTQPGRPKRKRRQIMEERSQSQRQ
ncbi:hypothetical protein LXL04_016149 [Taraxacum kok-saghyz]